MRGIGAGETDVPSVDGSVAIEERHERHCEDRDAGLEGVAGLVSVVDAVDVVCAVDLTGASRETFLRTLFLREGRTPPNALTIASPVITALMAFKPVLNLPKMLAVSAAARTACSRSRTRSACRSQCSTGR